MQHKVFVEISIYKNKTLEKHMINMKNFRSRVNAQDDMLKNDCLKI